MSARGFKTIYYSRLVSLRASPLVRRQGSSRRNPLVSRLDSQRGVLQDYPQNSLLGSRQVNLQGNPVGNQVWATFGEAYALASVRKCPTLLLLYCKTNLNDCTPCSANGPFTIFVCTRRDVTTFRQRPLSLPNPARSVVRRRCLAKSGLGQNFRSIWESTSSVK